MLLLGDKVTTSYESQVREYETTEEGKEGSKRN
jgi:hypothetical protein